MSFINWTRPKAGRLNSAHANYMAGPAWFLSNPINTLRMAAASSFFGEPKYYQNDGNDKRARRTSDMARRCSLSDAEIKHLRETLNALDPQDWRGLSPSALMERTIDAALDFDAEATLALAGALRSEDHIRTTPQVILVRAANHAKVKGTQLISTYAPKIIKRADEPAVGLAYQLGAFGKPIPNSLKRAWARYLESCNDYQLRKYRMENRLVKTADVVALSHSGNATSRKTCGKLEGDTLRYEIVRDAEPGPIDKLMGESKGSGTLRLTDETWEAIRSAGGSWEDAFEKMGHMALLRNIRNLVEAKIDNRKIAGKLVQGAAKGQQLPFRYWTAYRENKGASPIVLDAIEECLFVSMDNLPTFSGRVMSLCDNSGSAWGATTSSMGSIAVAEIANLTAAITAQNSEEGYVGVFGDKLRTLAVRKRESVFDMVDRLNKIGKGIGQSTENGVWLFFDKAISAREHWDSVFIYSDMQAGHGGLYGDNPKAYKDYQYAGGRGSYRHYIDVAKLIAEYRRQVNASVMVYLVQVAGYTDTIVPEYYDKTFILGGWSEGILSFAAKMTELYEERREKEQAA